MIIFLVLIWAVVFAITVTNTSNPIGLIPIILHALWPLWLMLAVFILILLIVGGIIYIIVDTIYQNMYRYM